GPDRNLARVHRDRRRRGRRARRQRHHGHRHHRVRRPELLPHQCALREPRLIAHLGSFGLFVAAFARASLSHPPPVKAALEEAYRIGVRSLPILLVISGFVGTNLAFQGFHGFRTLGGQHYLGMFVALAGVREMVPIMVAAMIAAKAGTEMASQIAVMKSKEQIDALRVMSVDPHWFLITPRFMGILLVLPALTALSIATMLGAAWAVVVFQLDQNGSEYLALAFGSLGTMDFVFAVLKAEAFAVIICLVACFQGFTSQGGPI